MKINSMKLTIIMILILVVVLILAGLFFIEIPESNSKVMYMTLGSILTMTARAISDMWKKE